MVDHDRWSEITQFLTEFQSETDRAAAVLGAAFIDDALKRLISSKLLGSEASKNELLRTGGPLGDFSVRIQLAFATGLISENARLDLQLVKTIRNRFAHYHLPIAFESDEMVSRCLEFRVLKALVDQDGTQVTVSKKPRDRFTLAVGFLLFHGIFPRIDNLPAFSEPDSPQTITMERV